MSFVNYNIINKDIIFQQANLIYFLNISSRKQSKLNNSLLIYDSAFSQVFYLVFADFVLVRRFSFTWAWTDTLNFPCFNERLTADVLL